MPQQRLGASARGRPLAPPRRQHTAFREFAIALFFWAAPPESKAMDSFALKLTLASFISLAVFACMRRWLPADAAEPRSRRDLSTAEQRRFARLEITLALYAVLAAPAAIYVWYELLGSVQKSWIDGRGPAEFELTPLPIVCWLYAFFAGLITVWYAVDLAARPLLRGPREEATFRAYSNAQLGYDGRRGRRWFSCVVASGTALFFSLGLDTYLRVTQDSIVVDSYFSLFARRYDYDDVRAVYLASHRIAPIGKEVSNAHYVVDFADGSRWRSTDGLRSTTGHDDRAMRLISRRSGVPLDFVRLPPDVE